MTALDLGTRGRRAECRVWEQASRATGLAAGFAEVQVDDRPGWRAAERRMWQEVVAAPAGADAGMQSRQAEGRRSLDTFGSVRRVFATATAP